MKNPRLYWVLALLFIVAVIFVILFSTTTSAERRYLAKALAGDAQAQFNLGVCYEFGNGVEKNLNKAIDLYKKAAAQGDVLAKERLQKLERK